MLAGVVDLAAFGSLSALLVWSGALDVSRWAPSAAVLPFDHLAVAWYRTAAWTVQQWTLAWFPFALCHSLFGALGVSTPGAWLARVELVNTDGQRPTAIHGFVRGLLYMTWPLTLMLAPALCAVTPSQRGLHDIMGRTWVVERPRLRRLQKLAAQP